jgi:hypothetical protein
MASYFPLFLPVQEVEEAGSIIEGFIELLEDPKAKEDYSKDIEKMKFYCEKFLNEYNKAFKAD